MVSRAGKLSKFNKKQMNTENIHDFDVLVAGSGPAGLAAAFFAVSHGLKTAVAGGTSGCRYMSGLLDFADLCQDYSFDPSYSHSLLDDSHPLRKLNPGEIRSSIHSIMAFLNENGLAYESCGTENSRVITSAGTLKTSYGYPLSMKAGIEAVRKNLPILVVEFEGMKGFSAAQIAGGISGYCKAETALIQFPGVSCGMEFNPEAAARSLDVPENRIKLAHAVLPHINNARYVNNVRAIGFPAVLGIYQTDKVLRDLSDALGIPVFEIPGIPPSVPGLRFEETMISGLEKMGVTFYRQNRISEVSMMKPDGNGFSTQVDLPNERKTVTSRSFILSTGRFFSRGLVADRNGISEPLLNLPVTQPETRDEWHSRLFFSPDGHGINRAGIETDHCFRPTGADGQPLIKNLFAAGAILANQEWSREKCGSALSFSTSKRAVDALKHSLYSEFPESSGIFLSESERKTELEVKTTESADNSNTGDYHEHIMFPEAV